MSEELQIALQKYVQGTVEKQIQEYLSKINLKDHIAKNVKESVEGNIDKHEFPMGSINNSAINWTDFKVNANMITGNFNNLNAKEISSPQLDVDDEGVRVINSLHSPDILATNTKSKNLNAEKGTITDLTVTGKLVAENIDGLNDKIQHFIGQDRSPKQWIHSNLRTVGQLEDLVVRGETLLGESLYASNSGRIGINTDEPTTTLSLWDEETNINIGKSKKDNIEVRSKNNITLGSAVSNNIELTKEGDTIIAKPILDQTRFTTVDDVPGFEGEKGDVAWNSKPELGKPVGWICLGGTVWAKFGIAE